MDRYINWVLDHPRVVMGCFFCIAIFFGYCGASVKMDNRTEVWLPHDQSNLADYHHFMDVFGTEEFILAAFKHSEGLTREHILLTEKLTDELEKEKGIEYVLSLSHIYQKSGLDFESFKQRILDSDFYRNMLISTDGKVTGLIILLSPEGLANRNRVVKKVREIVSLLSPEGSEIFLAGPPVFNVQLDQISQRVSSRYFPLLFCVALIILFFLFRSIVAAVLTAATMIFTLILALGWVGILGGSINMVTVALFPLMMVLSLAYSIYLLNAYNSNREKRSTQEYQENQKEIIANSFKEVWFPVFLSALTTGIGFCSLVVSDVIPVRDLGFYAAVSIASAFLLIISFLPATLLLFPMPLQTVAKRNRRRGFQRFSQALSRLATERKQPILIFGLIIFVVVSCGISRLRVETHVLKFFKKESQLAQAYAFIEERLTGLSPIEIVIESKNGKTRDMFINEDIAKKIKSLQKFLSQQKEVISSQSVVNILEDEMRGLTLRTASNAFQGFINEKERATRVSVKAKTLGSSDYQLLIRKINSYLDENFNQDMKAYTTGIVPLIVDMQDTVLNNLIESFSIAFVVIGVILFLLLHSIKNTLISMIPNIFPIAVVFGFMGWGGIKLDVATIMIASIALGIAVDDTIHFLFRFKREQSVSTGYGQPIYCTLSSTGKAIIFTSLVNFCGFFVLCFSDFRPMIFFGLLTGITIVVALIGDLIVLPASLVAFKVKLN